MNEVVVRQQCEAAPSRNRSFTLRTLLAFVLATSLVFSLTAWKLTIFRRQESAIRSLSEQHSSTTVVWESAYPSWFWERLERWSGVRCDYVIGLYVGGHWTLRDVECFRQFPRLKVLDGTSGIESDEAVEELAQITSLERLRLRTYPPTTEETVSFPTNRGMQALGRLRNLKRLELAGGVAREGGRYRLVVDDDGLSPLLRSAPLEQLDIFSTSATIEALRPLLVKRCLQVVRLPASFNQHIDELLQCESLQFICISGLTEEVRLKAPHRLFRAEVGRGLVNITEGFQFAR